MDKSSFSSTRQGLQAYVDGSFYNGKIGYGAVILENGNVIKEFSKLAEDTSEGFEALHQIGGEIQSVYAVLDWAKLNNISEIEICFDYAGLEFWATGTWKAENSYAARYQAYIAGSPVKVLWRKVKGHSGDRWNERADKLAKQACENTSVDLVAEVAEKAKAFSVYLQSQNINACFDRIYNQMCARIIFPESSGKNFLDIYNTSKKRLDPKWNTIADEILLDQVKELWSRFQAGNSSLLNANNLEVSELQYKINTQIELLRTYKYLKFDFIDLAELVTMFQIDRGRVVASADQMRYDFDLIEETFLRLIEGDGNG